MVSFAGELWRFLRARKEILDVTHSAGDGGGRWPRGVDARFRRGAVHLHDLLGDAMRIVGLSAYYHDSAAALLVDGNIVAAAQEERFTRRKHDAGFPTHALAYCLAEAGLRLENIDYVAFYDKPFLKFERLLETYVAFAPRGLRSFQKSMPVWIKEKLFQKDLLRAELERIAPAVDWRARLLFAEHHISHAASAYYPSPFDDALGRGMVHHLGRRGPRQCA